MDFYLKELMIWNENDKKDSWPVETPQIDITNIKAK